MSDRDVMLKVGEVFAGSYRIVGEVGSGNNGVVYLARHELLDREVALKVLRPELAEDREFIEALMNEARIAANLSHPNIVQALDAGSCNGIYYLAMEYVKGRTLEDIRLNSPEKISLEFLTDISIELAAALDYAWENFSIVLRRIGTPPRGRNCLGISPPIRLPLPAAMMTAKIFLSTA